MRDARGARPKADSPSARPPRESRSRTRRSARAPTAPVLELMREGPPPGLVRRFAADGAPRGRPAGGWARRARERSARARGRRAGVRDVAGSGCSPAPLRPLLRRELRDAPFPVQLRRRLELLGPTYIKLGQILSLREDILPRSVTSELRHLLNQLPGRVRSSASRAGGRRTSAARSLRCSRGSIRCRSAPPRSRRSTARARSRATTWCSRW